MVKPRRDRMFIVRTVFPQNLSLFRGVMVLLDGTLRSYWSFEVNLNHAAIDISPLRGSNLHSRMTQGD